MKSPLRLTAVLILSLIFRQAYAQDAIHIALIPFTGSANTPQATIDMIQNQVSSCFVNKSRFLLLDRGQTDRLKKELDAAKQNTSVYAKVVAEQGHLAGAEYIITGTVIPLEMNQKKVSTYVNSKSVMVDQYYSIAHLTLQINRVETGQVVYSQPLVINSRDFDKKDNADLLDNVLCRLKNTVADQVRTLFPVTMMVVSVDQAKKDGTPQKVLVSGGAEMFDNGKKATCPGDDDLTTSSSTTASVFKSLGNMWGRKKILLDVVSEEPLVAGGKTYNREKTIGELKMESVEGDLALCSVTGGDKDIKDYLDKKKPLLVKIKKDQ